MVTGSVVLMNSVAPPVTPPHAGVSLSPGGLKALIWGCARTAAVTMQAATVKMHTTPLPKVLLFVDMACRLRCFPVRGERTNSDDPAADR
ncbi:MAG: hypothetical protein ACYTF2_18105, partial [Planctomycetota bacterium]